MAKELADVITNEIEDNRYIVKLVSPVTFEGVTYTTIDLTTLYNLKGRDLSAASRYLNKSGDVSVLKEFEPEFCYSLAATATGLPMELFLDLDIRDALAVKTRVSGFLYARD